MSKAEDSGPIKVVKRGAFSIPIYWVPSRESYTAKWQEGGKTRLKRNKDLAKLTKKIRATVAATDNKLLDLSTLPPAQRAAVELVIERKLTVGDLERLQGVNESTLADAVERFIAAKYDASPPYIRNLRSHLGGLVRDLGSKPISSINTATLNKWLHDNSTTLRTRKNKRSSIVSLWRWARDNDLVSQDARTPAERTDRPSSRQQKRSAQVGTWEALHLQTMLETCPAEYLPWLVLQAFAGVRVLEIFQSGYSTDSNVKDVLQWEHIELAGKEPRILVPASVSKTAERRTIPIQPVLKKWLKAIGPKSGPVCPHPVPWKELARWGHRTLIEVFEEALETPWRKNALRHSMGTYRVLQVNGVGAVALEMGNSERMVKSHYFDVGRTKAESAKWFALSPAKVDRSLRASA